MDKETQDFCWRYDAYVRPSTKVHRRVRRTDYKTWSESDPDIFNSVPYDHISCVEIHMPEDRFRALLEHDHWLELQQRRDETGLTANAVRIAREHEHECRIRHEHPAVQAAWEQYQLLLKLSG